MSKVINPLEMTDWEIKHFLTFVLIIQLATIVMAGLNILSINIPLLPQIIGLIYLTLIPGTIIMRILRLHRLGSIMTLLYSVGLSLTFDMLLGFAVNSIFPIAGISQPVSTIPMLISWTVALGILCTVAYVRDSDYSYPTNVDLKGILTPSALFFILLPLLSIAGTQIANHYSSNIILLVLMLLIAAGALVTMVTKTVPAHIYPLAVFSIALSLLWQTTLISAYLTGWDIFSEYYFYSQVLRNGIWNPVLADTYNAMLSITILPAVYSLLLNMNGEAVFKIVYPVILALVPLALFLLYSSQFNRWQSYAATFFFTSISTFYLVLTSLARQMIAELLYVLLILLIVDKPVTPAKKELFILLLAGLAISHYSLSYVLIFSLILTAILLYILGEHHSQVTGYTVAMFIVICFSWYMFVSSAAPLDALVDLGRTLYQKFSLEFLNPFSRDIASYTLLQPSANVLHLINRILYYTILFFTVIGALKLLQSVRNRGFSKEYLALALGNYILLGACIIVPFFAKVGTARIFQLSTILLAPFTIVGAEYSIKALSRLTKIFQRNMAMSGTKILISLVLILFFLFNSGFIFEVFQDPWVYSVPLSLNAIDNPEREVVLQNKIELRCICPTQQEILGATWLDGNKEKDKPIYATYFDIRIPALEAYGLINGAIPINPPDSSDDIKHGYIYLGYINTVFGLGVTSNEYTKEHPNLPPVIWDINRISIILGKGMKVYTNGGSEIYQLP